MLQIVSKIEYNSATYPDPQTLLFRGKKSKEGDADFWAVRGKRDPPHHEAAGAAPADAEPMDKQVTTTRGIFIPLGFLTREYFPCLIQPTDNTSKLSLDKPDFDKTDTRLYNSSLP